MSYRNCFHRSYPSLSTAPVGAPTKERTYQDRRSAVYAPSMQNPRRRRRTLSWPLLALLALGHVPMARTAGAHAHEEPSERTAYRGLRNAHGYHPDALSRFEVQGLDEAVMQHIALRFAIEYRVDNRFVVLVPPWRAQELRLLAPQAQLLDQEINSLLSGEQIRGPKGYRDYQEVRQSFEQWEQQFPDRVALVKRPDMVSGNGKPFIVAKITKDPQKAHPKRPNVVITAATHGDEHLTTESLLINVEKLIKGYADNPRFKKIIDRVNLYIVPVVSPDSYLRSRQVHGVDPNRVYDFPGDPTPGTKLKSANAMMAFYKEIGPAGVLDFHGAPPKGMIMCPWGYKKHKSIEDKSDRDLHLQVVKQMGNATPGYAAGPIWSTIYVAPGNTTDHNYLHHKMLAIVIEIGGGDKSPPISKIPQKAKEVEEATWIFVEALMPQTDPEEGDEPEGETGGDGEQESTGSDEESDNEETGSTTTGSQEESESDSESSEPEQGDSDDETSSSDNATDEHPDDEPSETPTPSDDHENGNEDEGSNPQKTPKPKPKPHGGCQIGETSAPFFVLGLLGWLGARQRRKIRMVNTDQR